MPIAPSWRTFFVVISALALGAGGLGSETLPASAAAGEVVIEPLVTAQWLEDHLGEPDLVVLDCTVVVERSEDGTMRSVSGRAAFEAGHIPSAAFADLKGDLRDAESSEQFGLPSPDRFAEVMGALGVGDDSRVVVYDRSGSAWAARVWWMLRWIGFDRAAVLDGGLGAWQAEGRPLSTEAPQLNPRKLTADPQWQVIADRDEVLAAIDDDAVTIIDVLPAPHYRGEMSMYARPGHIAGAINIPITGLTDDTGHFRSLEELAGMHDLDRSARAITYCGGGIAASVNAFIMTRLGYSDVAVYIGSLHEWAADPELPMEVAAP